MWKPALLIGCCCLGVSLLGCTQEKKDEATYNKAESAEKKEDHGHDHPEHGPHKGDLIELGNEEYHGELVHDDKSLTIYILDGAAKKAVPIKATEITINISHGDEPEQFKLTAKPEEGEKDGMSSRFVSEDDHLLSHIDEEDTKKELVLEIDGKPFRGAIVHHHEGAGHDHDHDHDAPAKDKEAKPES